MSVLSPTVPETVESRKVCWLLPWYKTTNPLTVHSILAEWNPKIAGACLSFNDAMIQHSRNRLVDRFLASAEKFEWALFLDDDMVLPTKDAGWFRTQTGLRPGKWVGSVFEGLSRHGKTVVGALYMGRDPRGIGKAMFSGGDEPGLLKAIRDGTASGLQQTRWVGTGCMLIHRSVFEDVRAKFPHLAPKSDGRPWHYFTPMADAAVAMLTRAVAAAKDSVTVSADDAKAILEASRVPAHAGEDVAFCYRATAAGHPVYVDLDVVCGHMGATTWGPSNTTPAK